MQGVQGRDSRRGFRTRRDGTAILRMLLLPYKINIFAVELSDVRVHPENQGRRKATMSAKEIKDEIQRLNPTDKIEVYRWVSKQLHVADLLAGVGVYRCFVIRQRPPLNPG